MIFPKASKDITRKPDEPAVMAVKASASLFMPIKTCRNWKKFMQGKPVAEQEIGKQLLLETAAYAENFRMSTEKSCCTISVKNTWKKIVEIVIIV